MITKLAPNQIFVFGSNTAGIHGAGAAKQALRDFGAKRGVGEGLTGRCYAIPTVDFVFGRLIQRAEDEMDDSISRFLRFAEERPDFQFLLTKIGCGLAGYSEDVMKAKFKSAPRNVVLPEGW